VRKKHGFNRVPRKLCERQARRPGCSYVVVRSSQTKQAYPFLIADFIGQTGTNTMDSGKTIDAQVVVFFFLQMATRTKAIFSMVSMLVTVKLTRAIKQDRNNRVVFKN
jgi:hypothetical protein